jgi:uncharacterized protein involved in tolerance to divalent cations
VQIHPLKSIYRWKDGQCAEPEWLLSIKTRHARLEALAPFTTAQHAYAAPEIVQNPYNRRVGRLSALAV